MELHVPDMSCGHCTAAISDKITSIDPDAAVATNLDLRLVTVDTSLDQSTIVAALEEAGYKATPV